MRALRSIVCSLLVLATGLRLHAAGDDLKDLRAQLAEAEKGETPDNPAIVELSRRILQVDPHDQELWEKLAHAWLDIGDLKQCEQALDQWEKQKPGAPEAVQLRGQVDFARQNYNNALRHWSAYLALKPDETETYELIAWVYELRKQWDKADDILTKLIAVEDSAGSRVWRARCRLQMRKWDAAIADIQKANSLAANDETVKEWLPQFELLQKSLPKIRALDRKLADGKPQPAILLDRALLLRDAERYDLALQDSSAALDLAPQWRRAILQTGRDLNQVKRDEEAAKLRVIVKHLDFSDDALLKIGALDAKIDAKPKDAGLLTDRARECSDIEQYALALQDADAAFALDPRSAAALVESGYATMELDRPHEARKKFIHATELDAKNAIAWRSLGELDMDLADYPAAIENFSRSLKLHESPLVLQKREKCYRYSSHDKEADQDLQRWQKLTAKPAQPLLKKK